MARIVWTSAPFVVAEQATPNWMDVEDRSMRDIRGVCVFMELAKRNVDIQFKKWHDEFGATTACTLRCTQTWHNTGRIVIADSWFGSVRTALA